MCLVCANHHHAKGHDSFLFPFIKPLLSLFKNTARRHANTARERDTITRQPPPRRRRPTMQSFTRDDDAPGTVRTALLDYCRPELNVSYPGRKAQGWRGVFIIRVLKPKLGLGLALGLPNWASLSPLGSWLSKNTRHGNRRVVVLGVVLGVVRGSLASSVFHLSSCMRFSCHRRLRTYAASRIWVILLLFVPARCTPWWHFAIPLEFFFLLGKISRRFLF